MDTEFYDEITIEEFVSVDVNKDDDDEDDDDSNVLEGTLLDAVEGSGGRIITYSVGTGSVLSEDVESNVEGNDEECDSDAENLETFPYLDSESDDESLPWERESGFDSDEDVITLDFEDDERDILEKRLKRNGFLKCPRCPLDRNVFTNLEMFLVHSNRHQGRNHFVCPGCAKPFVKYSFCLAHEVRIHGQDFPQFDFPAVLLAKEYVKGKEEQKRLDREAALRYEMTPEEKMFQEIGGVLENPVHSEYDEDTDEDDPKFYPGHIVPSTCLYPYRGPPVTSYHEAYELQLKYGRKRRTAVNTIARKALLHRSQLQERGFLPDKDRKSKYHFSNPLEELDAFPSNPPKKSKLNAKADVVPRRKRNKRPKANDRKERRVRRTFLSSIISRTCVLCQFTWTTETELKCHRDQRHPNRTLQDLMTVVTQTKKGAGSSRIISPAPILPKQVKLNPSLPSEPSDPMKEAFLRRLGLIPIAELKKRKMGRRLRLSVRRKTKPCRVMLHQIPAYKLPRKGGVVYTCPLCKYFVAGKQYMESHMLVKHHRKRAATPPRGASTPPTPKSPTRKRAETRDNSQRDVLSGVVQGVVSLMQSKDKQTNWRTSTDPAAVRSFIGTSSSSS